MLNVPQPSYLLNFVVIIFQHRNVLRNNQILCTYNIFKIYINDKLPETFSNFAMQRHFTILLVWLHGKTFRTNN